MSIVSTVTATFHDRAAMERAVDDLIGAGFPRDDISVVMSNDTRERSFGGRSDVHGVNIANGTVGGGAVGGSASAIAGGVLISSATIAATSAAAVPSFLAGPDAGDLAGGGAGAAFGSVIGALIAAGVPDVEARAIQTDVRDGGVILAVRSTDSQEAQTRSILRRDGGDIEPGTSHEEDGLHPDKHGS